MGIDLIVQIVALLVVVSVHESAHAWVAYKFGDPTAKLAGRISLNPLRHIDPVGVLMMVMVHIGWGKPVPVNPHYFKHPKRENALTALAGPASNLFLALILALPLKYLGLYMPYFLGYFLEVLLDTSILLFAFNMLPFPPLDGSKFLGMIIPKKWENHYEKYLDNGIVYFMVFLLFDQFVLARIFGFSLLGQFMGIIYTFMKSILFLGL